MTARQHYGNKKPDSPNVYERDNRLARQTPLARRDKTRLTAVKQKDALSRVVDQVGLLNRAWTGSSGDYPTRPATSGRRATCRQAPLLLVEYELNVAKRGERCLASRVGNREAEAATFHI